MWGDPRSVYEDWALEVSDWAVWVRSGRVGMRAGSFGEGLRAGPWGRAWGLPGECAEGLFMAAVCQADLRAPEAVGRCWGYLEAVGVAFVGLL